jgi:hypothetical protein
VKVHSGVNKQKEYKALTLTGGILILIAHVGQSKCISFRPASQYLEVVGLERGPLSLVSTTEELIINLRFRLFMYHLSLS